MKIVIISDVHGNWDALSALPESYDELWVLGDLVNYGPQPKEVVSFVMAHASLIIRGNHDDAVGYGRSPQCSPRFTRMAEETAKYTGSAMGGEDKEFLRALPLHTFVERGDTRFFLCHATPTDPLYTYCSKDSDNWVTEIEPLDCDVVLTGHTHIPFVRNIGRRTLANPGSLGQPKTGSHKANYAVWQDGVLELKSFSYPVHEAVKKIEQLPLSAEVKQDLITVLRTGSLT